jgi:hypothetical protein
LERDEGVERERERRVEADGLQFMDIKSSQMLMSKKYGFYTLI